MKIYSALNKKIAKFCFIKDVWNGLSYYWLTDSLIQTAAVKGMGLNLQVQGMQGIKVFPSCSTLPIGQFSSQNGNSSPKGPEPPMDKTACPQILRVRISVLYCIVYYEKKKIRTKLEITALNKREFHYFENLARTK